jgi:hypothetical protein
MSATNSTPPPNHNGSSSLTQDRQNYAYGKVNHVTVEEAQNTPTIVPSTFFMNSNPILTIPLDLFFSPPENLGARFLLSGVVLSHAKILNFRM